MQRINKLTFLFLCILLPDLVFASKAGVVLKKPSGETKQICVEFSEEIISGYELLKRAGLNPKSEGGFIIEIDNIRSKKSDQMSEDDSFWSYWHFDQNWKFNNVGVNYSKVKDGSIEGWELSTGINSLPQINFEELCKKNVSEKSQSIEINTQAPIVEQNNQSKTAIKPLASETQAIPQEENSKETDRSVGIDPTSSDKKFFEFQPSNIIFVLISFVIFTAITSFWKIRKRR